MDAPERFALSLYGFKDRRARLLHQRAIWLNGRDGETRTPIISLPRREGYITLTSRISLPACIQDTSLKACTCLRYKLLTLVAHARVALTLCLVRSELDYLLPNGPKWGVRRVTLPQCFLHREECYYYTTNTICAFTGAPDSHHPICETLFSFGPYGPRREFIRIYGVASENCTRDVELHRLKDYSCLNATIYY